MTRTPISGQSLHTGIAAVLTLALISVTACASGNRLRAFGCTDCDSARAWGIAPIPFERVLNATLEPSYVLLMDHGVECANLTVGPLNERRLGFSRATLRVVQERAPGSAWGAVGVTVLVEASHGPTLYRYRALNTFQSDVTSTLDLPGGPQVPFVGVTIYERLRDFGSINRVQYQYLIDLRFGEPRLAGHATCARKEGTCQGGESRWRGRWAAQCSWDAGRQDFLCEQCFSSPSGYGLRTQRLWYFLFSNRRLHPRISDEETDIALLDFAKPKAGAAPAVDLTAPIGRLGPVTVVTRLPATGARGSISLLAAPASACFFAVEETRPGERRLGKACEFLPSTADRFFRGRDPWVRVDNDRDDEARLSAESSFVVRTLWRDSEGQEILEVVETRHSSPPTHTVSWIGMSSLPDRLLIDRISVASDTPVGGTCKTVEFPGFAETYSVEPATGHFSAELQLAPSYEVKPESGAIDVLHNGCPSTRRVRWDREKGFVTESDSPDCGRRGRLLRARIRPDGSTLAEQVRPR